MTISTSRSVEKTEYLGHVVLFGNLHNYIRPCKSREGFFNATLMAGGQGIAVQIEAGFVRELQECGALTTTQVCVRGLLVCETVVIRDLATGEIHQRNGRDEIYKNLKVNGPVTYADDQFVYTVVNGEATKKPVTVPRGTYSYEKVSVKANTVRRTSSGLEDCPVHASAIGHFERQLPHLQSGRTFALGGDATVKVFEKTDGRGDVIERLPYITMRGARVVLTNGPPDHHHDESE